jgi:Xaa-Pro aminopeptidase
VTVPASELERRLRAFQAGLAGAGIDLAVIVEGADLIYLTGCVSDAHLLVPAAGEPAFLVRRDLERARAASALPRIEPLTSLRGLPDVAAEIAGGTPMRIGFELDVLPAAQYLRYAKLFAGAELVDATPALRAARACKSDYEVERVRGAAAQLAAAYAAVPELLATVPTDRALMIELEGVLRRAGHEGPMRFRGLNGEVYFGAVLAGPDAAVPSYSDTPLGGPGPSPAIGRGPDAGAIAPGRAVTVDLCGSCDGYLADATRTVHLGELAPPLDAALATCEAILAEVERLLVPGTPWRAPYDAGLELAREAGFDAGYMGAGPTRVRFIGHGVGLEINEPPFLAAGLDAPLEAGNVIAVEPKLVFPGVGAVGVENTYLVRAAGPPENLTPFPQRLAR